MTKGMTLLCGSSASKSGVEVLASRLAHTTPNATVLALLDPNGRQLAETPVIRRDLDDHLSRLKSDNPGSAFLLALGLPAETDRAQRVLDEVLRRGPGSALLWERAEHTTATLPAGVTGLERVSKVFTLADVHIATIRTAATKAEVVILPAAIPRDFFAVSTSITPSTSAFAAFIGRTHPTKGAARLAQAWMNRVYPQTALPLRLFLVDHEPPPSWATCNSEAITIHRLREPASRARVMRQATAVIFPATHDHLPQALLESMASGALCVVTDIDGHSIVTPRSSGLHVASDLSDLTTIIAAAMRDPASFAHIRACASQTCAEAHSPEAAGTVLRSMLPTRR